MFGFGKKSKKENSAPAATTDEKKKVKKEQVLPTLDIADDKYMVMPQQYLPQGRVRSSGKGISKKVLLLGGGAFVVLVILSAVLYVVFLTSPDSEPIVIANTPTTTTQDQQNTPSPESQAQTPEITEKIIRAQAFSESNVLTGTLELTIPATLVQEYGSGIGITVLSSGDLSLPEDGTVLGGLYSLYPAGITFEEPLSLELIVSDIPDSYDRSDIYPAYLRGIRWQEFADYQVSLAGFTTNLEKIPSGPVAVIWSPEDTSAAETEELSFARVVPTQDTDGDGLTDAEELLFGTSSASPDTDGDSYLDLEEINNGYSPISADGGLLETSGIFAIYTNTTYGYQVQYPASWLADSLDQTNKQVLFISDTEEFFEILILENPLNTPIVDWFRAQSPTLANVELAVTILGGKPAVWSPDGLTLYSSANGLIYILTYNSGTRDEISWPNVFSYFHKNFTFGETISSTQPVEGETGTSTPEL